MPESLLQEVFTRGRLCRFGPDSFVFREGDATFSLYMIRSGVVEIQKLRQPGQPPAVVAYLSAGESFGEMAMITGRPRSASVRVPQQAELLEILPEQYEELLQNNMIFLRRLCEILAWRLERADVKIAGARPAKELQGDLRFFDVATVMQTLINSGQSGIMVIETPERARAEVIFVNGQILHARLGVLEGEEAFFQIFQEDLSGEFVFRGELIDPQTYPKPIAMGPMNLLLEALRMKDEVKVYLAEVSDFEKVYQPSGETFTWEDEDGLDSALLVWMKICERASLGRMLKEIPRCSYTILAIIQRLLKEGQIR